MPIDEKTLLYSSSGSGDIREKHIFQKQVDVHTFLLLTVRGVACKVEFTLYMSKEELFTLSTTDRFAEIHEFRPIFRI